MASKLPTDRGFYFSLEDFYSNAANAPEMVELWVLDDHGRWFVSGDMIDVSSVPDDLWRVRLVQK